MRLFRSAVQRPEAMLSPARWITASAPSKPAAAHCSGRESRPTVWPAALRNGTSAEPTRPCDPLIRIRMSSRYRINQQEATARVLEEGEALVDADRRIVHQDLAALDLPGRGIGRVRGD